MVVGKLRRRPLLIEIRDLWPESIAAVGALHARLVLRVLETLERGMYKAARATSSRWEMGTGTA